MHKYVNTYQEVRVSGYVTRTCTALQGARLTRGSCCHFLYTFDREKERKHERQSKTHVARRNLAVKGAVKPLAPLAARRGEPDVHQAGSTAGRGSPTLPTHRAEGPGDVFADLPLSLDGQTESQGRADSRSPFTTPISPQFPMLFPFVTLFQQAPMAEERQQMHRKCPEENRGMRASGAKPSLPSRAIPPPTWLALENRAGKVGTQAASALTTAPPHGP